jgi:hypothetical protein
LKFGENFSIEVQTTLHGIPLIREQIIEVAWRAGQNRYELPSIKQTSLAGPTKTDIEASSEMASEDRQVMISNMVERLSKSSGI